MRPSADCVSRSTSSCASKLRVLLPRINARVATSVCVGIWLSRSTSAIAARPAHRRPRPKSCPTLSPELQPTLLPVMANASARAAPSRSGSNHGTAHVREQTDLAERLDERCVRCRNHAVATHGQRCPCPRCDAVGCCHPRPLQRRKPPCRRIECLLDDRTRIGTLDPIRTRCQVELGQLGTSAKAAAGAGQHQCADPGIGLGVVQRRS